MQARRGFPIRRATRVASILGVVVLLAVAFQPIQATATGPSDPDHVNYAAATEGGTASAGTWEAGYEPAQAIDGSTATAWRATANDALLVEFDGAKDLFEVHLHLADHAMPEVELHRKQGDGSYAPLAAWSGNTATTLVHTVPSGVVAYGVQVSFPSPLHHTHSYNHPHEQCVDMHIHTSPYGEFPHCHEYGTVDHTHYEDEDHYARVAEMEAWGLLPGEADDGLSDGFEEAWWYRQRASVAGTPVAIPNNGTDVLVLPLERPTWAGVDTAAFLDLEVDHPATGDLAVAAGFWDGIGWDDRLVWTPGGFANASVWDTTEVNHVHEDLVCVDMHIHEGPMGEELHCHEYEVQPWNHLHAYASAASPADGGGHLTLEFTDSPTDAASTAEGTVSHVTIDLRKATLETWEQDAGFRTPQFAAADLQTRSAWRVLIRDWYPFEGSGSVLTAALVTEERSDPESSDTDGDGLLDGDDLAIGAFPVAADTDWDGLGDFQEKDPWSLTLTVDGTTSTVEVTTAPALWDSDGDGLSDGEEAELGFDAAVTNPAVADTDGDGLLDGAEATVHYSNATRTDTDGDGFADATEVTARSLALTVNGTAETRTVTTLPYAEDSDGDGMTDDAEWDGTSVYGVVTDPSDPDTDGDGLPDGQERYVREASIPFRRTVEPAATVDLSAALSGQLERAEVRYGLSSVDVSNFYLRLDRGSSLVLRDHQGSGLYNYSSLDITSNFTHGGIYSLYVSSDVGGGVLEEFALSFTLLTSPIDADSDGDGLNDSEEVTHGVDGWMTDPNSVDTDGDGWEDGYEVATSGTSPLAVDTDGDGAADPDDLSPLENLLVKVTVKQAHHGGAWWDPELAVVVRVNDDYSWVTQHEIGSSGYTASFYYSYHGDVPDDLSTVSVRASAWSFNDLGGDDLIEDGTVNYTLDSGLQSYYVSGGNSWITIDVETVSLGKAPVLLVTDGNVTVQAASGQTRMAAQDRFVVLTVNVTSASSPFSEGVNTLLVPRSLFLETKLWADFNSSSFDPLSSATLYGEDLSAENLTEGVAGLMAGDLTGSEAADVLDRLLRNSTDELVYDYVDVTSYAVLANLPADVGSILPWTGVSNGPTGALPQTFWEKIGAAATVAVNLLIVEGQLVLKGLVALGTFLVDLAQAVWDWGLQAAGEVWEAAQAAVEKVGEVLAELVRWAIDFMSAIVQSYVTPLLEPLIQPLQDAIGRFLGLLPSGEDPPGLGLDGPLAYFLLEVAPIVTLFAGVIIAMSMATGVLIMTMPIGAAVVVALTTTLLWALLAAPIEDLITQGSSLATEFLGYIAGMTIAGISSLAGSVIDFLVASGTAINGAILVVDAVAGFLAKFAFMASWSSWAAGGPIAGLAVSAIGWALVAAALIADAYLVSFPSQVDATASLILAAYGMAFAGAGIVLSVAPFQGPISFASGFSNLLLAIFSFFGFASAAAHLSST